MAGERRLLDQRIAKEYEDIAKVSMRTKQNKTYLDVRIQPPILTEILS